MKKFSNQSGFAAVEAALILVIVAILAFTGWFVWHAKQNTDTSLTNAAKGTNVATTKKAKTTTDNSQTSTQKYLTIKEWGVKVSYSGSDTFSYKMSVSTALIISSDLAAQYGCTDFGAGQIRRMTATDRIGEDSSDTDSPTIESAAISDPGVYGHVGTYYYEFLHDQAACSETVTATASNAKDDIIKALVPKFQAAQ